MLLGILLIHGDGLLVFLGALLGIVLGLVAPPLVLSYLAKRRARKFEQQLPDVLTLVASSLSTGFSLPQALDAVSRDVAQPAAKEFSRAMAETRIGSDIEDALERMADRMDSKNTHWAAMAIQIQRKVGGNVGKTLARRPRRRESGRRCPARARAVRRRPAVRDDPHRAADRHLPMDALHNREYISLLWQSLVGIAMSVIAVVLLVVGVFWMRKVVQVEVSMNDSIACRRDVSSSSRFSLSLEAS